MGFGGARRSRETSRIGTFVALFGKPLEWCVYFWTMATATQRVDWNLIWAQSGFRYFFVAMFVSLFGSGMNFAGVSWYILAATHSTVKVSWQVMVMTLPGLFVPFLGGVLIDRIDRRYLGVMLDLVRGFFVLLTAYIAWRGHLQLWHIGPPSMRWCRK